MHQHYKGEWSKKLVPQKTRSNELYTDAVQIQMAAVVTKEKKNHKNFWERNTPRTDVNRSTLSGEVE